MRAPLPQDTRSFIGEKDALQKTSNLGLLLNKYVNAWSDDWQMKDNSKSDFLKKVINGKTFAPEGLAYVEAVCKRQRAAAKHLAETAWAVETFSVVTESRLVLGLGGTSVIETAIALHPLFGFPYLPASGVKGLARAYAEIALDIPSADIRDIFGSEEKDPRHAGNNRQGKVMFTDGLPSAFPRLEVDIMNPHFGEYYQGAKPPADYLSPVPVFFLAVAAGEAFSFALFSRDERYAALARKWLIGGLTELGAGGKTNVGYGYFGEPATGSAPQSGNIGPSEAAGSSTIEVKAEKATQSAAQIALENLKRRVSPENFVKFVQSLTPEDEGWLKTQRLFSIKNFNIGFGDKLFEIDSAPANIIKMLALAFLGEIDLKQAKKRADKGDRKDLERLGRLRELLSDMEASLRKRFRPVEAKNENL